MKERMVESYAGLLSRRPVSVLGFMILLAIVLASGASQVETVEQNEEDLLPDTIDSIAAFDVIGAEFGQESGGATYTVLFQADPSYSNSSEIRDVRNPEMLNYVKTVSNDLSEMKDVVTVSSAADLVDRPATLRQASNQLEDNPQTSRFVSDDYRSTVMRITSTDLSAEEQNELAERIEESVELNERPSGVEVGFTGDTFIDQAFEEQTEDTMNRTSTLSLIGVFIVVVALFGSIFYGLSSLLALVYGIIAGFGLYGWLGFNMSPATSGAVSMGMGIAIDFGIQMVSRYREERSQMNIEASLKESIGGVLNPMSIALIAALIGFTSLSLGRITFLSDMGTMLTLTTLSAYIAALTVIPSALVIHDRYIKSILKVKQQ